MSTSVHREEKSEQKAPCRIFEILQYNCEPEGTGYHCFPISRIFRICDGRPAIEITRFVDVDVKTGAVELPSDPSQILPKGRPWRDVVRYNTKTSDE
ncbi:hypothetical protein PUNSTDRAFT_52272 [Punctularia strigosozonata HHB-11173 SS5]|uniref:uncharacterized protein n=1 Tax=Punctularia strigosozonata (strain HHB-11173) TaxID=741275 RepID=UPI000441757C|nr:uncharacterized protein PUNSTDRAFT_52272 [Punctularia strigosozonata HHB-11173 SS5]EIN08794.1 hypothetical protein PUNSTDRAFT_52272 [Punctularia strigosozonata HHB-11173 SS5]